MEELRQVTRRGFVDGPLRCQINRPKILTEVFQLYRENPDITTKEVRVRFHHEQGLDGGGLVRELFSLFWEEVESKMMEGNTEKVPIVTPDNLQWFFQLGRILSHGYVMTGHFPLSLAQACTTGMISSEAVSDDVLLQSFYNFIDDFESQAIQHCLTGDEGSTSVLENVVIPMLSRFDLHTCPTLANLRVVTLQVARYTFISKPYYALLEMKRGMEAAHPQIWLHCSPQLIPKLYSIFTPTPDRVWDMVVEPSFQTAAEQRVFDFLRRFVFSLSCENLRKLLRFLSGSSVCGTQLIQVAFNASHSEFTRQPTSTTCGNVLHIPTSYESFAIFAREFECLLTNSHMWTFDTL